MYILRSIYVYECVLRYSVLTGSVVGATVAVLGGRVGTDIVSVVIHCDRFVTTSSRKCTVYVSLYTVCTLMNFTTKLHNPLQCTAPMKQRVEHLLSSK
jgi:hypothetical protein